MYRRVRGQDRQTVPGGGSKSNSVLISDILAAKKNLTEIDVYRLDNPDEHNNE